MVAADADALLLASRANNSRVGVTGVLLYRDGNFFQYIEGAEPGLSQIWGRITASPLHKDIYRLFYMPVQQRFFSEFHMGFSRVPASEVAMMSQQSWLEEVPVLQSKPQNAPQMRILLDYWDRCSRGPV